MQRSPNNAATDKVARKSTKKLLSALATSTLLGSAAILLPTGAMAQMQAGQSTAGAVRFDIPAQPLSSAIRAFSRASGWEVGYTSAAVSAKRSTAVRGNLPPAEALRSLLSGTGISVQVQGPSTVSLVPSSGGEAQSGTVVLDTVYLDASANGTVGIVATQSATGSKTDTPILETPQTVNVVTRQEMDDRGVTDFNAAVAYTPGIRAVDYPGGQGAPDIYIRGFRAFNLYALYKDGLRAGFNQYDTDVEQFAFQRMDVLKGPSSGLYGQSAPGGLVNMETKRPTDTPLHEIQTSYGSYDRKQLAVDFGGPIGTDGTLSYRLTGLWRDSGTQIDHSPDDRVYIAPALTWRPTDSTSLTLFASYQDTKKGGAEQSLPMVGTIFPYTTHSGSFPSDLFLGEPGVTHYNVKNKTLGYALTHDFDSGWTFSQNARFMKADVDYISSGYRGFTETTATFGFQDRPKSTETFLIDSHVAGNVNLGRAQHNLVFGVDYGHYDGSEQRRGGANHTIDISNPVYGAPVVWNDILTTDTRSKVSQVGIYAQDQVRLDNWILTMGGRYDYVKQREYNFYSNTIWGIPDTAATMRNEAFSGRAGLTYLLSSEASTYVSYSTSFLPTAGVDYNGTMFKPSTGKQWEAGVKYQPERWNGFVSASVYQITQQNVTTSDPVNIGYSVQEGEVRARGLEIEAKAELNDNVNVTAGYAYTDARVTKDNANSSGISKVGSRLQSAPYHQASLWVDYSFPQQAFSGLKIGGGLRYVGSSTAPMNTTTGTQTKVGGYTLFDASVSYDLGARNPQLQDLLLTVSGTNLTDERYFTPGFYSDTVFYGNRRAVNATLSYKW